MPQTIVNYRDGSSEVFEFTNGVHVGANFLTIVNEDENPAPIKMIANDLVANVFVPEHDRPAPIVEGVSGSLVKL